MKSFDKPTPGQHLALVCGIMVIVFTFFLIFIGDKGISDLQLMKNERQTLLTANAELKRKNLDMYHEIERLKHDPAYIESIARQELGLIGKNEIVINMSSASPETTPK